MDQVELSGQAFIHAITTCTNEVGSKAAKVDKTGTKETFLLRECTKFTPLSVAIVGLASLRCREILVHTQKE